MQPTRPFPACEGVTHTFVDTGDVRIHVASAGPADGPAVLLVHGWPEHWWLWREIIPALARAGVRVIAPDLRGCGWSEITPDGYDKEQLATDILAVADAMDIDAFDLVGHDWGGWIAQLIALRAPRRVRTLALLNIAQIWQPASRLFRYPHRIAYQPLVAAPVLGPALQRGALAWSAARRMGMPAEAIAEFRESMREPARAEANSKLYRAFLVREIPAILRGRYRGQRLTVRTRVLFGLADPAVARAMLDGFDEHADDLVITDVPGSGHFIVDQNPARVLEWLRENLAALSESTGTGAN